MADIYQLKGMRQSLLLPPIQTLQTTEPHQASADTRFSKLQMQVKWSNEDKANKITMETLNDCSRKGLCEVHHQPTSCLRKTSMAFFHMTTIQYSKFLSCINIEGNKLCIFNAIKHHILQGEKNNLYCSIHAAAFIRRSLIMLSKHILQMDYSILESPGVQWICINLI